MCVSRDFSGGEYVCVSLDVCLVCVSKLATVFFFF